MIFMRDVLTFQKHVPRLANMHAPHMAASRLSLLISVVVTIPVAAILVVRSNGERSRTVAM